MNHIFRRLLYSFGAQGFAPPDPLTEKMSAAIRQGADMGWEETYGYRGCALGTAYYARTGRNLIGRGDKWTAVAKTFNMPWEIVAEADHMHQLCQSRLKVADWLESKGY